MKKNLSITSKKNKLNNIQLDILKSEIDVSKLPLVKKRVDVV